MITPNIVQITGNYLNQSPKILIAQFKTKSNKHYLIKETNKLPTDLVYVCDTVVFYEYIHHINQHYTIPFNRSLTHSRIIWDNLIKENFIHTPPSYITNLLAQYSHT